VPLLCSINNPVPPIFELCCLIPLFPLCQFYSLFPPPVKRSDLASDSVAPFLYKIGVAFPFLCSKLDDSESLIPIEVRLLAFSLSPYSFSDGEDFYSSVVFRVIV